MRLGLSRWSAAKVERLLFGGRGNPGQGSRRKSLDVQERIKHCPFSTGGICSPAVALSFVSIVHHVSKSNADKDTSRKQIRPAEKALYMNFQAHQVTIRKP
jgi:hypothetical protein